MTDAEKELSIPNIKDNSVRLRLQLELDPNTVNRLDKTRLLSGEKSNAATIKNALNLYLYFLQYIYSDHEIKLVKGERIKHVVFLK